MSIKHGGGGGGLFSTHGVPRSAVFENVYYYLKATELDANDKDDALLYYQRCLRFISNGDYLYDDIVGRCNTIRNR
ncbi:hypothetical protein GCM10011297_28040 [Bacterioplanes sanyensis]|nr:hypothetical protein GCM10011297_28040 [Bacterioplanes sanyensis]